MNYNDMLEVFENGAIRTKEKVLSEIDRMIIRVEKNESSDTNHTAAFYSRLRNLLLKFRESVEETILFEKLEDFWEYVIDIDDTGIVLKLNHVDDIEIDEEGHEIFSSIDTSFELITMKAKVLTVERYAEAYGVTGTTVRQWIRRGKIKSAIKNGREWRIPELAEITGRGYQYGCYSWEDELSDIPEEYAFLNECTGVDITQDDENKNVFHIYCWNGEEEDEKNWSFDLNTKEKEKFELMLISNPLITAPTDFKNIYS